MRLIDADDALQRMDELLRSPYANDKFMTPQYIAVRDAIHLVKDLCIGKSPTVDAVPVVHCRECCFGQKPISVDMQEGYMYCKLQCKYKDIDAFCSEGEPREAQDDG